MAQISVFSFEEVGTLTPIKNLQMPVINDKNSQ